MLERQDILGEIDAAAQQIAARHDRQAVDIAALAVRFRSALSQFGINGHGIEQASALFDLCSAIDADPSLHTTETEVERDIVRVRREALLRLITLLYDRRVQVDIEHLSPLRAEMRLALSLAPAIPSLYAAMGMGAIGPDWLRQHCSDALYEDIEAFVYDWEGDCDRWERFTALLPSDMRERFDASLVPLELPSTIESVEQARALVEQLAKRRGLSPKHFFSSQHLVEWARADPKSFRLLMRYGQELKQHYRQS